MKINNNNIHILTSRPLYIQQGNFRLKEKEHKNWFFLDLERGQRGWFPGCSVFGRILIPTELKEAASDESNTLKVLELDDEVEIENIISTKQYPKDGWYKVKVNLIDNQYEGYIKYINGNNVAELYYSSHVE